MSADGQHRKWGFSDPAIGDRIRERRVELGFSQRGAVRDLLYTAAYLSRIEAGQRTPSVLFLRAIAPILECSVAWLETGEDLVDIRVPADVAKRLYEGFSITSEDLDASLMCRLGLALGFLDEHVIGLA